MSKEIDYTDAEKAVKKYLKSVNYHEKTRCCSNCLNVDHGYEGEIKCTLQPFFIDWDVQIINHEGICDKWERWKP